MNKDTKTSISPTSNSIKYGVILFMLLAFMVITSIPFVYQTTTLWYKVGADRIMLYTGQLFGLYAVFLFFLQLILIAKLPFLVTSFGLGKLTKAHQLNGKIIIVLALSHIFFILFPEGLSNIPLGMKFWPEMLGGLVFFLLVSLRMSVWVRTKIKIDYTVWKSIHRFLGFFAFVAIVTHVVKVSDAFDNNVLLTSFLLISALSAGLFFLGKYLQKHKHTK